MGMILDPYRFGGTPLPASLDFENGSNSRLERTMGAASSNSKGCLSVWVKRESTGASHVIVDGDPAGATNPDTLYFNSSNQLRLEIQGSTATGGFITSTTYTSTAIWYHIFLKWDAAQTGTAKVYVRVNGVEPSFGTDGRASFTAWTTLFQSGNNQIGARSFDDTTAFDGLMADLRYYDNNFTPVETDFGQDNAGTWSRKTTVTAFTYGNNGFHIDGSGTVGSDISGNGNNFTGTSVVTSATIPPEV